MHYVEVFSTWLKSTAFSAAILHYTWIWPTCESLHFIGMAFLVGIVGLLDLRILGVGRGLSIAAVHRFLPWGIAGFAVNLITGALFFAGDPYQYVHNPAFQWKMVFILAAGVNVMVFYATGIRARVEALGPSDDAPLPAKVIAGLSLAVWVAVMYCGRMLPYLGNAF
jgi:hypothetical protein